MWDFWPLPPFNKEVLTTLSCDSLNGLKTGFGAGMHHNQAHA